MMITGGCGFIGSNFIRYMLKESDEIEQKDKKWLQNLIQHHFPALF